MLSNDIISDAVAEEQVQVRLVFTLKLHYILVRASALPWLIYVNVQNQLHFQV